MTKSLYKLLIPNINKIITFSDYHMKLKKYLSFFSQRKPTIFSWSSSSLVLPVYKNKRIAVYNGKLFSVFQLKNSMLLGRIGLLVRTKKLGSLIHVSKKKKKKNKK